MAQQAYAQPAYPQQNRGTLIPGQTISVNNYTVQVERYLSQGGFAHVYLVRTSAPVLGTTQHVLKRIAVPDEAMLSEVKKEVDIMRILKRHPNIVQLIDAAWHRMPNGMYEVFILMEFCSGGGIIDMMNRRLRERLTEAEILQIFVDVCEGVAAMHNLRPPLLHRDLKVENILQASPTSFKLCDFGSATPVTKPPTNALEMRTLEADLNKHTTLQYRAPEMVDLYLRRAVDEKSDVWALGVLLYKLCYYTTPFEEHGPLAILNVQYKIPPYPVYSNRMNELIASMLREHGALRPSVFEVLTQVHRLRGTTSRFTYSTPPRQQPLSPRLAQSPVGNPLDDLIAYKSSQQVQSPNAGVQAREKVLEAIAPMRRGRPGTADFSSPKKEDIPLEEDDYFGKVKVAADGGPKLLTKTGGDADAWKLKSLDASSDDAWAVNGQTIDKKSKSAASGFDGFGDSFDGSVPSTGVTGRPSSNQSPSTLDKTQRRDAFEGLGLSASEKAPPLTLGQARQTGMGLAANGYTSTGAGSTSRLGTALAPSPTPRPSSRSESSGVASWRQTAVPVPAPTQAPTVQVELSIEQRFPSLEELDLKLTGSPSPPALPLRHRDTSMPALPNPSRPNFTGGLRAVGPASSNLNSLHADLSNHAGVRSQHVTGTAMRESREQGRKKISPTPPDLPSDALRLETNASETPSTPNSHEFTGKQSLRPTLSRRHRSSISIHHPPRPEQDAIQVNTPTPTPAHHEPQDWLTGDDTVGAPVLRESPSKRASVLQSTANIQRPQEAVTLQRQQPSMSPVKTRRLSSSAVLVDDGSDRPIIMQRKDSSSSPDEEGPEDVSGFVRPKVATKKKHKGRQSSVHDLVDLWGGGLPVEKEKPRASAPSSKEQPQTSPLLASTSRVLPPTPVSSALLPPKVDSLDKKKLDPRSTAAVSPLGSNRSPTRHHKAPSSVNTGAPATPDPRSRPQSMFLFPVQKTPSDNSPLGSPALSPPADGAKSRLRRTSISDMVSRFEAIGGKSMASPAITPSTAAKLKLAVATSPTAASQRFPRLSPNSSPVASRFTGTSIPISSEPQDVSDLHLQEPSRTGSTSPVALRRTSPNTTHPVSHSVEPVSQRTNDDSRLPKPRISGPSPSQKQPLKLAAAVDISPASPHRAPKDEAPPRSPSPDRPYQGVGKLIDRWQRISKEGDNEKTSADAVKPLPKKMPGAVSITNKWG